ncbi:MAG: CerR family C-terminal domain-containing protein [Phycisphaerales bacterium]|jgi:AcrR family transcriptional regulator|nr:CerR family C-terminal domain-containing protein [Phycisphaerales bacterium]
MEPVDHGTRERLLDAAGEVFADRGYEQATIREICRRAGANIAAVSYHFGDKKALYIEVIAYAHRCADEYDPAREAAGAADPAERLRVFVRTFMQRIGHKGRPAWHARLMAREMASPGAALDQVVRSGVRPKFEALQAILRTLNPSLSDREVERCACSIVGQCLIYHHARPVLTRLFPTLKLDAREIERISEHITRFSLAAVARAHPRGGARP